MAKTKVVVTISFSPHAHNYQIKSHAAATLNSFSTIVIIYKVNTLWPDQPTEPTKYHLLQY